RCQDPVAGLGGGQVTLVGRSSRPALRSAGRSAAGHRLSLRGADQRTLLTVQSVSDVMLATMRCQGPQDASGPRVETALQEPLEALIDPSSIAVVGASDDP